MAEANGITFSVKDGEEMIKLCRNGDIYIRGKLTINDLEVVEGMREFLKKAMSQQIKEDV